jgi:demethoxyubiquinone hydroxylase (CLK1/Coq7/Cat5 family)
MAKKKTFEDRVLIAHQGELDADLLYRTMADVVRKKNPDLAEIFEKVAKSEMGHARVCQKYTGRTDLKPSPVKAIAVKTVYKYVSKKLAFQLLIDGEYDAARDYMKDAYDHSDIAAVMQDEIKHGNTFKDCQKKYA